MGDVLIVGVGLLLILAVFRRLENRAASGTSPPESNRAPESSAPGVEPLQVPDPPAPAEDEAVAVADADTDVEVEAEAGAEAEAEAATAIDALEGDLVSADGYVFLPEAQHVLVLPPLSIEQLAAYEAATEWHARHPSAFAASS